MSYDANLLGAVSLAVTDAVEADAVRVVGLGGQAAGALVLIDLRPGTTIKRLAERLSLSHPGTVRLVDRLVAAGLVARGAGDDHRTVRLHLTPAGAAKIDDLRRARVARLDELVGALGDTERRALRPILEGLARALTTDLVRAFAMCRLCDTATCEAHGCPVEAEARARFGAPDPDRPTPER